MGRSDLVVRILTQRFQKRLEKRSESCSWITDAGARLCSILARLQDSHRRHGIHSVWVRSSGARIGHMASDAQTSAATSPVAAFLFLPFFSSCAPERSDTQIEKQQHHTCSDQEHVVIGAMSPACPHAPQIGRKGDHWKQKKDTRNLKPHNAAHPAKRTKKATHAFDNTTGLHARSRCSPSAGLDWRIWNGLRLCGRSNLRVGQQPARIQQGAGLPRGLQRASQCPVLARSFAVSCRL